MSIHGKEAICMCGSKATVSKWLLDIFILKDLPPARANMQFLPKDPVNSIHIQTNNSIIDITV